MAKLKLNNISKEYGKLTILNNINLDIKDGEFLVLVGPSGCGKSTTLRIIAGLESPSNGNIYIKDKLINEIDPSKRDIAMVFQNYALYPHMTVFNNMAFALKLQKLNESEINKRVLEASEILMIQEYLYRKPKELSGGQRQRVALGRAIVRKPKVFLFDEPLSNLDAKLRSEMRVEIKKLHKILGATMIYVTHDQTEAMTMGDRIAVMNHGNIEQLDSPRKLYDSPKNKFIASFIGSPEINFINGKINIENNMEFIHNKFSLLIPKSHPQYLSLAQNMFVTMGIRPEDLHYATDEESDKLTKLECKVNLVENLGSNIIAHCQIADLLIKVHLSNKIAVHIDDMITVLFDVMKAHFYNIDDGKII